MVQARHVVAPIVSAHRASTCSSHSDQAAGSDGLQRHIASGLKPCFKRPYADSDGTRRMTLS